ncbi:M1 family metallopeptidase [Micromonospora sp. NPDC000442]|uniref:M1 family metallopeptidase n=1 Tax=Micromonospora sp. NPDC000442 TaxID=3364217 RepID=UPI00367E827E
MTGVRTHLRRSVALLLVGTLGLTGCDSAAPEETEPSAATPSESAAPAPDFQPGAAGAGDPYFPSYGNGGYDVAGYTVKVRYDPAKDQLSGVTTVQAKATADLSSFNLDLAHLKVSEVTVDGAPAQHRQEKNELVVTPADGLVSGRDFTAEITYAGKPKSLKNEAVGEGGWLHTSDGAIALGQPESASTWFPVNDHPSDKATYRFEITVPDGLTAISNGVPGGKTSTDGWTTWRWAENTPMASYLSMVTIGKFRITEGSHKGRPVFNAVTRKVSKGAADASMAKTIKVADYLETVFGPYPVEAYGGVVVSDERIRYALETQSRSVYSAGFFRRGENTGVVAHEVAHQWFGNSVALSRWQDIWLNEGLSSYAEWLWAEHTDEFTAKEAFEIRMARVPAEVWRTPPGKPGVKNMFSESVYQRGAMTVHALRVSVGDKAFFEILKTWAREKRDANATTEEFVALAERISGEKLDKLFDAWLYGKKKPAAPKRL